MGFTGARGFALAMIVHCDGLEGTAVETLELRASAERRATDRRNGPLIDQSEQGIQANEGERRHVERRNEDQEPEVPHHAARLNLKDLQAVVQDVAREMDPRLDVLGVMGANGASDYVEILLGVRDCGFEPCRITVGVDRTVSRDGLKKMMAKPIRQYLRRRQARSH